MPKIKASGLVVAFVAAQLVLFNGAEAPAATLATLQSKIASWETSLGQLQRLANSSGDAAALDAEITDVRTALAALKAQIAELTKGRKQH